MENVSLINEEISRMKKLMNISEATDVYSNVDFKDRIVGSSTPSTDTINTELLNDVQTAAERANVKIDITTAVSGHHHKPSRHPGGNAVDISIINGKSVSRANRADADKFVKELEKMGYVKNKEVGNPKAVLTFGFPNHDNHVHVSKVTNSTSNKLIRNDQLNSGEDSKFSDLVSNFNKGGVSDFNLKDIFNKILKMIFNI